MLNKKQKLEKQNELLKKIREFRETTKLKFSKNSKPLRITKQGDEIKNVSITLPKDLVEEISGVEKIYYTAKLVNETDFLICSGCAPVKKEPAWMRQVERHFGIKV